MFTMRNFSVSGLETNGISRGFLQKPAFLARHQSCPKNRPRVAKCGGISGNLDLIWTTLRQNCALIVSIGPYLETINWGTSVQIRVKRDAISMCCFDKSSPLFISQFIVFTLQEGVGALIGQGRIRAKECPTDFAKTGKRNKWHGATPQGQKSR